MVLSASPCSLARSSLEEMLDSLRRRDEEEERKKECPPALPARPASRARLPPARRSLPVNFKVSGSDILAAPENGLRTIEERDFGQKRRRGGFGSMRVKKDVESPYVARSFSDSSGMVWELEGDDSVSYFIKKKLRVWCRQPRGQWELGTIQSTSGEEASVSFSNGHVMKVVRSEILPANPNVLEGVDDLIKLGYLNEPSSKAGPILISLNPFKDLQTNGNDYESAYRQRTFDTPHVYAVADAAYNKMIRGEWNSPFVSPSLQSVLYLNGTIIIFLFVSYRGSKSVHYHKVSSLLQLRVLFYAWHLIYVRERNSIGLSECGESGSGKTETAKIALQYLAAFGGDGSFAVENEFLQINRILEAFGNAKTSGNNNSGRFGKLIEVHFSSMGKICGANIQTCKLALARFVTANVLSRVVQLGSGERSYHIFYQLCAGSSSGLKERLNLRAVSEYKYLVQSDCMSIDGVDDAKNFHQLMEALETVQICKEDQELIFKMLAAILWLGNISFQVDSENHIEVVDDEAVTTAAQLMDCSSQELMAALCTNKIQSDEDAIVKILTLSQAIERRDEIAKFIYASLFDWLLEQINKSLQVGKQRTGKSISILDIYGFQNFQDYELDGIDWTKVDFEDNEECLDLFEKKPGLLSLLDEESNLAKASGLTFANKLKHHLDANSCFKGERGRAFSVRHYAGEVLYDTNEFLEKNRDMLSPDSIQFLSSCNCELLQLFSKMFNQSQKQSVATKFKDQLFKLMHQLESTTPHFICCIKPNTKQLPGIYDEGLVLQQLRCCGVLEVVKLSRAGYPTRMTHQEFSRRYGPLLSETNVSQDPLSISVAVLQKFSIPSEMYHIGYTKLYLRAGQIVVLENKRKQVLKGILGIQKCVRGHQARGCFSELKNGVTTLQSFIRGENTRRKYGVMVKSSITIYCRKLEEIHAIILLQSVVRGWLVRRDASLVNRSKKYPENAKPRLKFFMKIIPEVKDLSKEPVHNLLSAIAELQRQVDKADAIGEQKEEENIELKEQLKQSEKKRIEYEAKMKSMEEAWQKQMASLQMSLVAARKSLAPENAAVQPVRHDFGVPRGYDSEDAASMGSRTPGSTPMLSGSLSASDAGRQANGTLTTVGNLMKEFEQRRHTFDDEVKALSDIKPGQSANTNSVEELRKLKQRFEGWKNQYKVRLREAKARLSKSDAEKSRRSWWGKLSSKA
ncbi:hypothetical protein VNO78_06380 [Psophocarpus tetragonolobus]|uniref:Myosin-2 n=1 Tax=Psophocarpus tetragonolobus TaxID=3891 RepID=A0AAN9SU54_PSOTE